MPVSSWRAERNAKAQARLDRSLPDVFPRAVLIHARAKPFLPPTPRRTIESYWRHHPLRADALARALAARSVAPGGWTWQIDDASHRAPPTPFREAVHAKGPGFCCICGQPVFRYGWHRDLWGETAPNHRATWHGCCVAAWNFWTAPSDHLRPLKKRQNHRCALSGARLLKTAEVDHHIPLFRVWRDHRDTPWPALLSYWGAPNLQVINRAAHVDKSAAETAERATLHPSYSER